MKPQVNRQIVLCERPHGIPQPEHFEVRSAPVPPLRDGEFMVRNQYLSVDPAMRTWVNLAANYSEPVGIGEVMHSFAAGEVIASRHPGYAEGDKVMGMLGWQEYAVTDGQPVRRKVLEIDLPLSLSLGVLGINGVTAYFALKEIGVPKTSDTVVVSTAAGAVGSAVGQIARIAGCRTVGVAGGAQKIAQCIETFSYSAAVDYKSTDFERHIAAACPNGVDVYYDNTAGRVSDVVLRHINKGARIIICGTSSVSTWDPWPIGPRVERHLLNKAARMQGFLIWDYEHRYDEAVLELADWIRSGNLRYREEIRYGLEAAPAAIASLYRGENQGKLLIKLHE